jgi:hypothetical protein
MEKLSHVSKELICDYAKGKLKNNQDVTFQTLQIGVSVHPIGAAHCRSREGALEFSEGCRANRSYCNWPLATPLLNGSGWFLYYSPLSLS